MGYVSLFLSQRTARLCILCIGHGRRYCRGRGFGFACRPPPCLAVQSHFMFQALIRSLSSTAYTLYIYEYACVRLCLCVCAAEHRVIKNHN